MKFWLLISILSASLLAAAEPTPPATPAEPAAPAAAAPATEPAPTTEPKTEEAKPADIVEKSAPTTEEKTKPPETETPVATSPAETPAAPVAAPTTPAAPAAPTSESAQASPTYPANLMPTGFLLGYRYQFFDYREPKPGIREYGSLNGLLFGYERPFGREDKAFMKLETEYLFGKIDYDGAYQSGSPLSSKTDDQTFLFRGNAGVSLLRENNELIRFYSGLMYRYLYDYVRAPGGYRREITQISIPFGMTYRKAIDQFAYSVTGEVDSLLAGIVRSHLSDVGPSYSDIKNKQTKGYGARIAATFEWSHHVTYILEPSFQYWEIDDSDVDVTSSGSYLEPHNTSKMYNLNLTVRF